MHYKLDWIRLYIISFVHIKLMIALNIKMEFIKNLYSGFWRILLHEEMRNIIVCREHCDLYISMNIFLFFILSFIIREISRFHICFKSSQKRLFTIRSKNVSLWATAERVLEILRYFCYFVTQFVMICKFVNVVQDLYFKRLL